MLFRSDRKSTRLNSSHTIISYAVFCLKKKKTKHRDREAPVDGRLEPTGPGQGQTRTCHQHRTSTRSQPRHPPHLAPVFFFFFNDPGPPEISPLPHHAPLPI